MATSVTNDPLGELNTARTKLFFVMHPSFEAEVHNFFDARISTSAPFDLVTPTFSRGSELNANPWLYEMNRKIMPVEPSGPGMDLGDFAANGRLWQNYADNPNGGTYITAHNADLRSAFAAARSYYKYSTQRQLQTVMADFFAGAALGYEMILKALGAFH